jgi:PIN domain nuclease of toxin-antitoxin system
LILIDANVLIWWMTGDSRLGEKSKKILASSDEEFVVSLLTLFEIELKRRIGKLEIQAPISEFLDRFGVDVYQPFADELTSMMGIEIDHSDPFDCALVGLAKLKKWKVMTSDQPLLGLVAGLVTALDSTK